jgi:hypothetical protein
MGVGEYLLNHNVNGTARYFLSVSGMSAVIVAAAGLLTAYGIRAERAYPQMLAPLLIAVAAVWAIFDQLRSGTISTGMYAVAAGAFATIKYILRSPEATEYYNRIRHPDFSQAVSVARD